LIKKDYLIVIPVYNEAATLERVAAKVILSSAAYANVLLINDGSTDETPEILEHLKAYFGCIGLIQKRKNEGYGATLACGFEYALRNEYKYLITMDCDDQHQPEDIIRFVNEPESIDLVSGSRYLPESGSKGIKPPVERVEINFRITKLLNRKYGWNLTDSFCGFKRYRLSSFSDASFEEKGYSAPMEMWSYVHSKGLSVKEISVDKIYITADRTFGDDLDKKRKRFRYYLETWRRSHRKFSGEKLWSKKAPAWQV